MKYTAEDGTLFSTERECLAYEKAKGRRNEESSRLLYII